MITTLVRTARIASLRAQIWWLRQAMENAMSDTKPKRRRKPAEQGPTRPRTRRKRDTMPELPPDVPMQVLNGDNEVETLDNGKGVSVETDAVNFYAGSPLLENRRIHFDSQDLIQIIGEGLIRNGMPKEKLGRTRWLWVGNKQGCPELFLILPGIEG